MVGGRRRETGKRICRSGRKKSFTTLCSYVLHTTETYIFWGLLLCKCMYVHFWYTLTVDDGGYEGTSSSDCFRHLCYVSF